MTSTPCPEGYVPKRRPLPPDLSESDEVNRQRMAQIERKYQANISELKTRLQKVREQISTLKVTR